MKGSCEKVDTWECRTSCWCDPPMLAFGPTRRAPNLLLRSFYSTHMMFRSYGEVEEAYEEV